MESPQRDLQLPLRGIQMERLRTHRVSLHRWYINDLECDYLSSICLIPYSFQRHDNCPKSTLHQQQLEGGYAISERRLVTLHRLLRMQWPRSLPGGLSRTQKSDADH
jgi:hypothetical protein